MSNSAITKKAISESFKKLCHEKPYNKISISDITDGCGLNRQSFYYHFQDKCELLNWILSNEDFSVAIDTTPSNWREKLTSFINIINGDKTMFSNIIASGDPTFERFIYAVTYKGFSNIIYIKDKDNSVPAEERELYAQYFAYGFTGVIINWIKEGYPVDAEILAARLRNLAIRGSKISMEKLPVRLFA